MKTPDNCPAWNALDWKKIHYHVRSFQERIALAAERGDWKAVRSLQRMVFASWDCRVFAVHRVTCRKAVRTAGLDGVFWHTDESRFAAVDSLLKGVLADLKQFLAERGLWVSDEKTVIGSIYDGVDYIGWHFVVNEYGLVVSPAQIAIDELTARLRTVFYEGRKWTARRLIIKLNGIVRGWGGYHGYLCTPDNFVQIDDDLQDMIWQWAVARHRHHKPRWVYNHYWHVRPETRRKEFSSEDVYLLRFAEVRVKMKVDLDLSKNPYLDRDYFRSLEKQIALPRKLMRLKE